MLVITSGTFLAWRLGFCRFPVAYATSVLINGLKGLGVPISGEEDAQFAPGQNIGMPRSGTVLTRKVVHALASLMQGTTTAHHHRDFPLYASSLHPTFNLRYPAFHHLSIIQIPINNTLEWLRQLDQSQKSQKPHQIPLLNQPIQPPKRLFSMPPPPPTLHYGLHHELAQPKQSSKRT